MTIPVLMLLLGLHLVCGLVQLGVNGLMGPVESGCTASLACGNPAVERLLTEQPEAGISALGLIWELIQTLTNVVFGLLVFDYRWLNGGPEVVQMFVNIVRGILVCVYIVILLRIGGDVARSLRLPFS